VAASFQAIYSDKQGRPTLSHSELCARQALCENLAQGLAPHCETLSQWRRDASPEQVLAQVHAGLLQPPSSLPVAEAGWVTRRSAELLHGTIRSSCATDFMQNIIT
jgi:hypothetical protein